VINIREKTKVGDYMIVDNQRALVALAQRNIVEFHSWNSRDTDLERPDRIVFDLDPGPAVPWRAMVEAARLVRKALAALGLNAWLKTTGGKGLHVVVPDSAGARLVGVSRLRSGPRRGDRPARPVALHDPVRQNGAKGADSNRLPA
jgi:DNA primase